VSIKMQVYISVPPAKRVIIHKEHHCLRHCFAFEINLQYLFVIGVIVTSKV
jgi:hypothetical protein